MHPFILRLQQLIYRERTLHMEKAADRIEVTRQTLSAWVNEKWKPPLDGAQRLVGYANDPQLSRAFVQGTGLCVVPKASQTPTPSLFRLIGDYMQIFDDLLRLAIKIRQGNATPEDYEAGRRLLEQFRNVGDQIEIQLNMPPTEPIQYRRRSTDKE